MIIVDGGSTDDTEKIIVDFQNNGIPIKFFKYEAKKGPGPARVHGISLARGKYIAFIDSDDIWHPNKLESQFNFMDRNNFKFTYTKYFIIEKSGKKRLGPALWLNYTFSSYFKKRGIGNSSVMIDKDLFDKISSDISYSGFTRRYISMA